jgi:hypothetical protein
MNRNSIIAVVLVGLVVGACIGCLLHITGCVIDWQKPKVVRRFQVTQDLAIVITAVRDPAGDTGPGLFYDIRRGDVVVDGPYYFWVSYDRVPGESLSFALFDNATVAVIYDKNRPNLVLAVHDFQSQEGWPCHQPYKDIPSDQLRRLREKLEHRVRTASGNQSYELN